MFRHMRIAAALLVFASTAMTLTGPRPAIAAEGIDRDVEAALRVVYDTVPTAKALAANAKGILVFPNIVKAGFLVGAQYGEGALLTGGKTAGYYNIAAASYGFQAGVQSFGYAMFLMSPSALDYLHKSGGWEVGVGPSVVVFDEGLARTLTTSTIKEDIYAVVFGQKGLMAGAGLQGSKITKTSP